MSKTLHSELDYIQGVIDVRKIHPSPYQHRRHFDVEDPPGREDKLKELACLRATHRQAVSIQGEGLIEPIIVRPKSDRYELIAGERLLRAVQDFTEMEIIQAQIVIAGDLQARRISAGENLQREDLSVIETIEAIVEIVDAELMEDIEYLSMGRTPADRLKTLLGKLDSMRRCKERGYSVSEEIRHTSNKFIGRL
ncbi:MAG: ParB N-terminal domain-containing protein [Deltaproteobacteria bacterium]|nr:ParB N-terminal domain-containing protein [Deltaproteobacteria bacterium]